MKNISKAVQLAKVAAQTADLKLGREVLILDVRGQTAITEMFLFVGATSHLHVRSLEDTIREKLKEQGAVLVRTDGQRGGQWRVLDYGFLLVHLMDQKTRDFYSLERLWDQGKTVRFRSIVPTKPRRVKSIKNDK